MAFMAQASTQAPQQSSQQKQMPSGPPFPLRNPVHAVLIDESHGLIERTDVVESPYHNWKLSHHPI